MLTQSYICSKFELSLFESEQVKVHNTNKREKLEGIYKRKRKLMKIVNYLNLKIKLFSNEIRLFNKERSNNNETQINYLRVIYLFTIYLQIYSRSKV